jgi:hypothetical protein
MLSRSPAFAFAGRRVMLLAERRRAVMESYASWLSGEAAAVVVPFRRS